MKWFVSGKKEGERSMGGSFLKRMLNKNNRTERGNSDKALRYSNGYDNQSGQAYFDYAYPAAILKDIAWYQYPDEEYIEDEEKRSGQCDNVCNGFIVGADGEPIHQRSRMPVVGSCSLVRYVCMSMVNNLDELTREAIDFMPPHLATELFIIIYQKRKMTFEIWKVFQEVLKGDKPRNMGQLRFRQAIDNPKIGLGDYTRSMLSPSMEYLVHLSITIPFPVHAYVRLADLKNLGILEIVRIDVDKSKQHKGDDPPQLDDRVVRAWSDLILSDGAFPLLRILKLWYHKLVTPISLSYVSKFPSLAFYDVRGCGFERPWNVTVDVETHGWRESKFPDSLVQLEEACLRGLYSQISSNVDITTILRKYDAEPTDSDTILQDKAFVQRLINRYIHEAVMRVSPYPIEIDSAVRTVARSRLRELQINQSDLDRTVCPEIADHDPEPEPEVRTVTTSTSREVRPYKASQYCRLCTKSAGQRPRAAKLTWEYHDFTSFAKIGELRRDKDFERMKINMGDQTFADHQLISPFPMASFRLGPNIEHLSSSYYSQWWKETDASPTAYSASNGHPAETRGSDRHFLRPTCFYRMKIPDLDTSLPPTTTTTGESQDSKRKAEKPARQVKKPKVRGQFSFMPSFAPRG